MLMTYFKRKIYKIPEYYPILRQYTEFFQVSKCANNSKEFDGIGSVHNTPQILLDVADFRCTMESPRGTNLN
jgi:hypothetical protein